jgi:hypothetical protein
MRCEKNPTTQKPSRMQHSLIKSSPRLTGTSRFGGQKLQRQAPAPTNPRNMLQLVISSTKMKLNTCHEFSTAVPESGAHVTPHQTPHILFRYNASVHNQGTIATCVQFSLAPAALG